MNNRFRQKHVKVQNLTLIVSRLTLPPMFYALPCGRDCLLLAVCWDAQHASRVTRRCLCCAGAGDMHEAVRPHVPGKAAILRLVDGAAQSGHPEAQGVLSLHQVPIHDRCELEQANLAPVNSAVLESACFCCLQADVQIYNKILALVEDWSEAIDLPAYRQELSDLRVGRFGPTLRMHACWLVLMLQLCTSNCARCYSVCQQHH